MSSGEQSIKLVRQTVLVKRRKDEKPAAQAIGPVPAPGQSDGEAAAEHRWAALGAGPGDLILPDVPVLGNVVERQAIERALREVNGNKSKAARQLGISRTQLYLRLRKHRLERVTAQGGWVSRGTQSWVGSDSHAVA